MVEMYEGDIPKKFNDYLYHCSFCGKNKNEVSLIIASFTANICSNCVLTCVEVIIKSGLNKVEHKLTPNYAFPEEEVDES